ncbi:hypothetical protein OSB04_006515 [Centaurea solstitialis]|uniref:Uncharacterized protein n=1 Tax=Centaurea solstitialis TaxID=347529 RepID=A0AA38TUS0_9ASTR|nr:hypothetical protein OSB04_006515 [Centaurea solstitialis]
MVIRVGLEDGKKTMARRRWGRREVDVEGDGWRPEEMLVLLEAMSGRRRWVAGVNFFQSSNALLNEIASVRGEEITYLNENHKKIWSRSKFTEVKCDNITNNISKTFNS